MSIVPGGFPIPACKFFLLGVTAMAKMAYSSSFWTKRNGPIASEGAQETNLYITEETHDDHPNDPLHSLLCTKEKQLYNL